MGKTRGTCGSAAPGVQDTTLNTDRAAPSSAPIPARQGDIMTKEIYRPESIMSQYDVSKLPSGRKASGAKLSHLDNCQTPVLSLYYQKLGA